MSEVNRTSLDWARDIARAYRWALMRVAPAECERLDADARATGQRWITPLHIPADAADHAEEAVMSPKDIAHLWGIPVGTIYGWASKGLLKPSLVDENGRPVEPGQPAKYLVSDVMSVESRRMVRRLDIA